MLLAEAHIRLGDPGNIDGYGAVIGRDLEQAMAVVDSALAAGIQTPGIKSFMTDQAARQVEPTRVKMETFR